MARTYIKMVGSKTNQNYTQKTLQNALIKVKNHGWSIRDAAARFGVPKSTLWDLIKGKHPKKYGGQTILSEEEETRMVQAIVLAGEWGYPFTSYDLRLLVKCYVDRMGRRIAKFKNNLPGMEWVRNFMKRHKKQIAQRIVQNLSQNRAAVTKPVLEEYFKNLETAIAGVPPSHIVNYDETNFTDDPGRPKVIVKRGCKRAERVMNSSKASTSVMFAAAADGHVLSPYIVYRSEELWKCWMEGGDPSFCYNRSKSGWFDMKIFSEWFETVALPYLRRLEGKKILIGDNLSSHLSVEVIKACENNNIQFILLPPNSTGLLQPLDVSFFHPLKVAWRKTLDEWKKCHSRSGTINKSDFPALLEKTINSVGMRVADNVKGGFKGAGIVPFNPDHVFKKIPFFEQTETIDDDNNEEREWRNSVIEILESMRPKQSEKRQRRKKVNVQPGKSVSLRDFESEPEEDADDPPSESEQNETSASGSDAEPEAQENGTEPCADREQEERMEQCDESDPPHLQVGDFYTVQYSYTVNGKQTSRVFVGKLIEIVETGFVMNFMRSKLPRKRDFIWPTILDEDIVNQDMIQKRLPTPTIKRGIHTFPYDIFVGQVKDT